MAASTSPIITHSLTSHLPDLSSAVKAWATACSTSRADSGAVALEDDAREAASMILNVIRQSKGDADSEPGRSTAPLILLDDIFRGQGDKILEGVSAGHYFRLRQFILSESSNPSFRLLTPLQSTTTALEHSSPSTSIPHFGPEDVVLECSDRTRHLTHSYVLAFHSPVLGKKIEAAMDLGYSAPVHKPSLPVVSLDIHPKTLAVLLGFCYGTTRGPPPSRLSALAPALLASRQYEMRKVEKLITGRWDELAKLNPLEAYFVAVQNSPGLEPCARAAAMIVLERPIANSYVYVMESSSALAYWRILEYYGSCNNAVEGHLKRVITEWAVGPTARQALRHQDTVNSFLQTLIQRVQDHGPRSSLDVDVPRLFQRFCSSNSTRGQILWPDAWWSSCGWVVDGLLDISNLPEATENAIDQITLNF